MSFVTEKGPQGEIITKYLADYPATIGSKTLARIIYRENQGLWKDLEAVRTSVRYYRGRQGGA